MSRVIRGYAAPWNQEPCDDRGNREILPGAIDPSQVANIALQWGVHGGHQFAQTRNGTMQLFADEYGLGFEATLSLSEGVAALVAAITSEPFGASISMVSYDLDGAGRVTRARIDHVALVYNPAYVGTAAWLVDEDGQPSGRSVDAHVRTLAAHWNRGRQANLKASLALAHGVNVKGRAPASISRGPSARRAPATLPVSVARLLASGGWAEGSRMARDAAKTMFGAA